MLTQGPLGFPLPDRAARRLDALLRRLPQAPEHRYRHLVSTRGNDEVNTAQRWDVSWISTESVDRVGEVVLASGMDDSQYRLNPLVTLGHDYQLPPVGSCAWRRRASEGGRIGVKARTDYPPRPDDWPADAPWLPDQVLALVRAGLLRGKSIGFLPLRVHAPSRKESEANGWGDARLVIDEWLLLEYACVSLPANQHALVEAVAKGDLLRSARTALRLDAPATVAFTPMDEIQTALTRRLATALPDAVGRAVAAAVARRRGRV